jgi:hypothetical protein
MGGFRGVVWGMILIIAGVLLSFMGIMFVSFSSSSEILGIVLLFIGIALAIYGKKVINK